MIYKAKEGAHVRVDPQIAGERLEVLREQNGGLSASLVVDDARPEASPLHPQFEWDDSVAAEEHRKAQARLLMRSIYAVVEGDGTEPTLVPAFVQVTQDGERRYEAFSVVVGDPELWEQVLEQARRDWRSFEKKYRQYSQLASLFEAADAIWQEVA